MSIAPLVWLVLAQVTTTPLVGTVVGPGGEPVVGAELMLMGLPSYDPPVVARGKSGEGGHFSLDRPATLAGDHSTHRAPVLWVMKPGYRISQTLFPEALPGPADPLRITLGPPGKAQVRVEGPDGRPIPGARVLPGRLKARQAPIPDPIAEVAAGTTGADGLAVMDAAPPEELIYVDVHAPGFGIQGRQINPIPGQPTTITLRPVSTWAGRLTAADPAHLRGWKVRAWTQIGGDPNDEPATLGYVETTVDDAGRFALDPIAVGPLRLGLTPPGDLPVRPDPPESLVVREGQAGSADIPLREAAVITGLVAERGTGKPLAGVDASLSYIGPPHHQHLSATTDERGRYTFRGLPGKANVYVNLSSPSFVLAPGSQRWDEVTITAPPKVVELAPREVIPAAPPLRGKVVDEAGQALTGATVHATWQMTGEGGNSNGGAMVETDPGGNFVLEGLGPGSDVSIVARLRERQLKEPVKLKADAPGPLTLRLDPTPVLALAGRLVGPGGAPLGGVPVRVEFRIPQNNSAGFPEQARFEGNPAIRSGPDGSFRTPKELERKPRDFRVEVTAPGFLPARTEWIPSGDEDLVTLPELVVKRSPGLRVVTGRVVDRDGEPIPGATVSQSGDGPARTTARADADGRFRLAGVAGGPALVFAEAPGCRFGGAILGGEGRPAEIRLARESDPPIATLKSLPSPLPRAEERALARELLAPLLGEARAGSLGMTGGGVIPTLARVDPDRVLAMIEDRVLDSPTAALMQAVLGLHEIDPAAAIGVVRDDLDPAVRASGWLFLEQARPSPDRARRADLLGKALADARDSARPEQRVRLLGRIAGRWLELGERDGARPILLELRDILAAWPRDRWDSEVESVAGVLAVVDLPAALELAERRGWTNVSPADPSTIAQHKGEAATRLAATDPAEAERLIGPASGQFHRRTQVVITAARRMAEADPARARRLVESLGGSPYPGQPAQPTLPLFGLGALAFEMAGSDPARGRALLDEAFAGLRKIGASDAPGQGTDSAPVLLAALLPAVERLAPDRLAERTWQAAASRPASPREPNATELEETFALAMLVSRYDRAIADAIAAPALERLPDLLADPDRSNLNGGGSTTVRSLAAYDPRAVVPLLRALPGSARRTPPTPYNFMGASVEAQIRLAAAQILGVPPGSRPAEASRIGDTTSPFRLGE